MRVTDLTFTYNGSDSPTLRNFNLELPEGSRRVIGRKALVAPRHDRPSGASLMGAFPDETRGDGLLPAIDRLQLHSLHRIYIYVCVCICVRISGPGHKYPPQDE